jgi:hypothetical protein
MSDTTLTDLGPFFERYDRRNRCLMVTGICASLILSALIATRLLATGAPGLKGVAVMWGTGVVFSPLFISAWSAFGVLTALRRRKAASPDGRHPLGAVDAGNGMRIVNAGFAFNLALIGTMLTGQLLMAMLAFGFGHQVRGDLVARAIMLTVGAATIYLGNLWPRMPVSRAPAQKAALRMKANRYAGWLLVIIGLLIALWGLFFPNISPPAVPTQPPYVASRHREIALPAAELDKFVGRYDFGNNFAISVTHNGATLWVLRERSPGARAAPIYPEAPRAFFWKAVEAQIRFTTDATGAVTGAEFREGGTWQPGKRLTP